MHSNAGVRTDLFQRPLAETLLTDFFGGVAHVELSPLPPSPSAPISSDEPAYALLPTTEGGSRSPSLRRRKKEGGERVEEGKGEGEGWMNSKVLAAGAALVALQVGGVLLAKSRT